MRSLTLGSLALVALLLLPGAQAAAVYDVAGKWYWVATGTVGVSGLPGLSTQAHIEVGDDGSFSWRITFDPLGLVALSCADGTGMLAVDGAMVSATQACSLEFNGAYAVPRATLGGLDLGAAPGPLGYLGVLGLTLQGSGAYLVA